MGATDSNGIWKYDSSDVINTWPAYGNLLANSVSNTLTDIRPKTVYTASSQSDANTKVTALAATGVSPSASAPLFFWRTDTQSFWVRSTTGWYDTRGELTVNNPLTSGAPTASSSLQFRAGTVSVKTNDSGDASISYASAFPGGVAGASITPYDPGVGDRLAILNTQQSTSTLTFRVFQTSGNPLPNYTSTWSYVAIGW